MDIGYELIREQLFFRKELVERVSWFIRLRWAAFFFGIAGAWILYGLFPEIPIRPITLILLSLPAANIVFWGCNKKLKQRQSIEVRYYAWLAHVQITFDFLVLFLLIHFTGGLSSPFLMFAIFHVILAGMLLSPPSGFVYGGVAAGLLALQIAWQQWTTSAYPASIIPVAFGGGASKGTEVLVSYLFVVMIIFITAALTTSVKISLRKKGRALLAVSRELDAYNTRFAALYRMLKEIGSYQDLQKLLDNATRQAAQIMGVKGCSIKLLAEPNKKLKFAACYGLSDTYIAGGEIDPEKSPINKKILQGAVYSVGRIDEKMSFQFPDNVQQEGVTSILCLPLRVEKTIFGIFCVYSESPDYFGERDQQFFSLMADLTALAIEKLRNELNKAWFVQKAAHQLRSPVNAILSMLKTVENGYLGALPPKQADVLLRCEKRLYMLGELVNELLDLSMKRSVMATVGLHPVDAVNVIQALIRMYESQAREKGLALTVVPRGDIPTVMAEEKLLDDLFSNLLSNAVKYTPAGGKIRVALEAESNGMVCITVSDTGIGIPADDLPHLFTEFFRGRNAKEIEEEGNGLGLVIVKEIVDRLRGILSVDSDPGRGTSFTVHLPSS